MNIDLEIHKFIPSTISNPIFEYIYNTIETLYNKNIESFNKMLRYDDAHFVRELSACEENTDRTGQHWEHCGDHSAGHPACVCFV